MSNIFVEPLPRGDHFGAPWSYQLEFSDSIITYGPFLTAHEAVALARRLGHRPLLARVRNTNKAIPEHWRCAS